MEIKVLGKGCPLCGRLEMLTKMALEEAGIEASVEKVTDLNDIMSYDVFSTPALVINEEVKCMGRIPAANTIKEWIQEAASK